ncbi:7 transmembrane receptor (rhodopsin family) domain-containing protein [Ditylenchus destructor]|uniref:7 transmembrane receptor (Rhodopsin family) domain-containing protein n=1 Tax=Ditylenchus destructor TaxID=166010 RepID=A0AAD4NG23_9BILA|nr:7 transmembrane receptor (rhodopsin family) domain-containing protein [Ditylenchus destructor]
MPTELPSRRGPSAEVWPSFLWRNHSGEHCTPIQAQIPEKVDHLEFQLIFTALYLFIWLCAIVGNVAVIYVVSLKQVKLSSVRSVFIVSLAMSDLVMSLTSLPITAVSIFTRDWVFPRLFCNLMGVFQGGSVFVNSFTLTSIAVDRYILIRHPAAEAISLRGAILIILLIWIVGYSFALPVGIFSSVEVFKPLCGLFCDEFWPDADDLGVSRWRKIYGIVVLLVQFGLPAVISSLCYCSIGRIIRNQIEKRKRHQIMLQDNQERLQNRKSRSNRMMLTMVMGLVLAWLPMNLINLWRDFDDVGSSEWYSLIFALCHATAMTSAVWNPIIYSWFNPQFKQTLRSSLKARERRITVKRQSSARPVACCRKLSAKRQEVIPTESSRLVPKEVSQES